MILLESEVITNVAQSAIVEPKAFKFSIAEMFQVAHETVTENKSWAAVSGADTVEVMAGSVILGASSTEEKTLDGLSLSSSSNHHSVNFGQQVRLKSLTLSGFTYLPEGSSEEIVFSASADARLVISIPHDELQWLPLYAVPHVSKSASPRLYYGASFNNNTITFPADVPIVNKIRLSVIKNFSGEDDKVLPSTITNATARIKNLPEDLEVTNQTGGSILFEHQGLYANGNPYITLNMINHAQAAYNQQLAVGEPLSFTWEISAKPGTAFNYSFQPIQGALLRVFSGTTTAELEGERLSLPLDLSAGNLSAEIPSSVSCRLNLTYNGRRVLEKFNDALPAIAGNLIGKIVADEPAGRVVLDPDIATYPITRLGLIGRAPETCELSVWLAPQIGDGAGEPLSDPGVVQIKAGTTMQVIWVDLPQTVQYDGALRLQVRANKGRFFWVSNGDLLCRVVVEDPEPGNRPIMLNNLVLKQIQTKRPPESLETLNPQLFSSTPPTLSSNLFVTVELSDLTLRYNR